MFKTKGNIEVYKRFCLSQSHRKMSIKCINKQLKSQVEWLGSEAD